MRSATVKAAALVGWAEMMATAGISPDEAGRVCAIDPGIWIAPDGEISLKSFVALSEYVGACAGAAQLSWQLGESYDLAALHEVGDAVLGARTLGTALKRFAEHFPLLQDACELRFDVLAECAQVSYRILDPDIWPRHHDALFTLAIVAQIIRRAAGPAWRESEFLFEAQQGPVGPVRSCGSLRFAGETNALRFPLAMLDLPMPAHDHKFDLKLLSRLIVAHRRAKPVRDKVEMMLFSRLADGVLNQEKIAAAIGMSSRTMRRKLAEDGLSFQHLLDECRMRQAVLDFHVHPKASIAQIALKLGYAEHSTFTRAFTRWAGIPPNSYRSLMN
ncbi:MAG: helix-turn-helix transcriptional regulator [Alphaproteobacteria bacterium]|nr:helix-turn-helix transcriptional regulator [Alphaproteobacteria bacterium]MDE2041508.1 AraC family transcriptional regulator ligand-binding domain-containing protein [Alphaproteobacteria bacterium]MDE2339443.1 AraC family transcriptional regulator ligand-binding domain-containing protein [Alphaproteobacteria bacterium]